MMLNVMQKASVQCKQVNFFTRVEQSLNLQLGEDCVEKVKDVFIYIPPQALNAVRHSEGNCSFMVFQVFQRQQPSKSIISVVLMCCETSQLCSETICFITIACVKKM